MIIDILTIKMFIIVLVAHFIGDFVFQRNIWAQNKSSSNVALTKHLLTYTATLAVIMFPIYYQFPVRIIHWVLFNGLAHWGTDYFTSRWTKRLWNEGRVHDFFVVIGLDQLIHYVTMLASMWLFSL